MRKLDTSAISQAAQFPVKAGTLDHVQLSYQEAISAILIAMIGADYSTANVYILFGCVNGGAGAAVNLSAGAVFYNGEVYLVDATNFFLAGGAVAIPQVQLSYYGVNADPVLFTDKVQRSVHQIRKMVIVPGASGSGLDLAGNHLPDFLSFKLANPRVSVAGNIVGGAWPNFTVNQVNKTLRVASFDLPGDVGNSGNILSGGVCSSYPVPFPDLGTAAYIVNGQLRSKSGTNPGQVADAACNAVVSGLGANGFTLIVKKKDNASGATSLAFDYEIKSLA